MSAGTVGTPHILLHSGVGDKRDLTAVNISSVLNLPSVGKNLTDQPLFFLSFGLNITNDNDPWAKYVCPPAALLALNTD